MNVAGWGSRGTHYSATQNVQNQRPHVTLRKALDRLKGGIAGYAVSPGVIDNVMSDIETAVTDPTLPVYEIEEHLSVLNGRIDGALYDNLSKMLSDFKASCEAGDKSNLK